MKRLLQLLLIHFFIVAVSATVVPKPKINFVMADNIGRGADRVSWTSRAQDTEPGCRADKAKQLSNFTQP